jgi:hypothetical protein
MYHDSTYRNIYSRISQDRHLHVVWAPPFGSCPFTIEDEDRKEEWSGEGGEERGCDEGMGTYGCLFYTPLGNPCGHRQFPHEDWRSTDGFMLSCRLEFIMNNDVCTTSVKNKKRDFGWLATSPWIQPGPQRPQLYLS